MDGIRFTRRRRGRVIALVATVFVLPILVAVAVTPGSAATRKAVVLGSSVTPSSSQDSNKSVEQVIAERQGFGVTVVDDATWLAMSEAQFRTYDEIIIGDPTCSYIPDAAVTNLATWAGAVMHSGGNRFVIGSDPQYHNGNDADSNRAHVVSDGISYAGRKAGSTGVFLTTSCEADENNVTILNVLSLSGTGWSVETPTCAGNIGIIASVPGFTTHDADLSNWSCSSHSDYPSFASDWVPFAISADACRRRPIAPTTSKRTRKYAVSPTSSLPAVAPWCHRTSR